MRQSDYDSTVARIAGNILSGAIDRHQLQSIGFVGIGDDLVVKGAVAMARAVVAEIKRTESGQEA